MKSIAVTLLSMLQTRLALLGNEIQIGKRLITQQLGLGLALMFCLGVGVLLAVALAVQLWWDYRVAILAVSTALFLVLAACFYGRCAVHWLRKRRCFRLLWPSCKRICAS